MTSHDFSSRFVQLPDGRSGLRSIISVEIKEPSPSDLIQNQNSKIENPDAILDFIASDESLDRYSEIISAAGWKLDNYQRNPVFQNAHQYGDILHTLGRAVTTEVRGGTRSTASPYLFQRIQFACDVNPLARIAYGLYKGKFLNAVSVGFVPIRWEEPQAASSEPNEIRNTQHATRDDLATSPHARVSKRPYRIYLEQELLEVSAVAIPANPNALALGLKSGAIEKSDLRDTLDLFRSTLGWGESPREPSSNLLSALQTINKILRS